MVRLNLPQLLPPNPTCRECELGNDTLNNPGVPTIHVPESLPKEPNNPCLIILGQNPGFQEDRENRPFIGKSGDFVRRTILNHEGLNLNATHTIYLANVARCCSPAGFNIKVSSYNTCWSLHSEIDFNRIIAHHNSHIRVIALGKPASIRVYQLVHPKKSPGTKIQDYFNCNGTLGAHHTLGKQLKLFFTFHPAAILRENKLAIPYSDHLELIKRHITNVLPPITKPSFIPLEAP